MAETHLRTVVMGLHGMCTAQIHEDNLDDFCQRSSKIKILGALNFHYTIYQSIVNDDVQFINRFFNGQAPVLDRFYNEVKFTQRANPRSEFSRLMERYNIDFIDGRSLNQVLNYHKNLGGTYMTSLQNNINMRAPLHVSRLLKTFYQMNDINNQHTPTTAEKQERTRNIDHVKRYLFNPASLVNPPAELLIFLEEIMLPEFVMDRGSFSVATNKVGYGWTKFVPLLIRAQVYIEDHNETASESDLGTSSLTVLPQHNFETQYAMYDRFGMAQLFNKSARRGQGIREGTAGNILFDRLFRPELLRRAPRETNAFKFLSNGVELHLLVNRPTGRDINLENEILEHFEDATDEIDRYNKLNTIRMRTRFANNEYRFLIGIDWGSVNTITYCRVDLKDNNAETIGYLKSEDYYREIKQDKFEENLYRLTNKYKKKERQNIQKVIDNSGAAPSDRSAQFKAYAFHKLRMFNEGTRTWFSKSIRRLKFQQYRLKSSFLDRVQLDMTKGEMSTINCGINPIHSSSIIKGSRRAPINDLIKTFDRAENIDLYIGTEFNSTKMCSKSFQPMIFPTFNRPNPNDQPAANQGAANIQRSRNRRGINKPTKKQRANRSAYCPGCVPRNFVLPSPAKWRKVRMFKPDGPYRDLVNFVPPAPLHNVVNEQHIKIQPWNRDGNSSRVMGYTLKCHLTNTRPDGIFIQ